MNARASFVVDEMRLRQLLASGDGYPPPSLPGPPGPPRTPTPAPLPAGEHLWQPVGYLLAVFAVSGLALSAFGVFARVFVCLGTPVAVVFGVWAGWGVAASPLGREWYARYVRRRKARQLRQALIAERRSAERHLAGRDADLRRELTDAIRQCRRLADEFAAELDEMTRHARDAAFAAHLQRRGIVVGEIPNIAEGRVRQLASHGIRSAADISEYRVMSVPGFNQILTAALLDWRRKVEHQFRFDPARELDPTRVAQIAAGFHRRQAQLVAAGGDAVRGLYALLQETAELARDFGRQESAAAAAVGQAEADYRETDAIGLAKPGTLIAAGGFAVGLFVTTAAGLSMAVIRATPPEIAAVVPDLHPTPRQADPTPPPTIPPKRPPVKRIAPVGVPTPPEPVPTPPEPVVTALPLPGPELLPLPVPLEHRVGGFARGADGLEPAPADKRRPPAGSQATPKLPPPVVFTLGPRAGRSAVLASGPEVLERYERLLAAGDVKTADGLVAGKFVYLVGEPVEMAVHSKSPAGFYVRVQSGPLAGRVFAADPWFVTPTP